MIWRFIFRVLAFALKFRYRIELRGYDELLAKLESGKKGILFLPNHPAHMDPVMAFCLLWPKYRMRPLVVEHVYRVGFLGPFMRAIRALPIPNFDTSVNQWKVKKAEKSMQIIADGLKAKENFILYPAARLKSTAKEVIGGSSGTHALIQECPGIEIVLMRTTGLWGSMFSRAIEGRSPEFSVTIPKAIKTVLKNIIFFIPRRRVVIEFEIAGKEFPRKGSRVELNRYLENWYDQYPNEKGIREAEEPLKLVPYSFWNPDDVLKPLERKKKNSGPKGVAIVPEVRDAVYGEIRRIMENPDLVITDEMNLAYQLGMDSLNVGEMIAFLSREYDIPEAHPEDLETVLCILELAQGARQSGRPKQVVAKASWPKEVGRPDPVSPAGKTLAESFLITCDRMGKFAACGDDMAGVLTYDKIKLSALVLAQEFKKIEGKHVGVLLPASAGAFVTILALQFAGKVPVMLNWTLGPRYLEEMVQLAQVGTVLSSWRFLERLSHVDFGKVGDSLLLLEDVRKSLSFKQKLKGALIAKLKGKSVLRMMGIDHVSEDAPAVILFTSGTEATPKGVPLSHKNIISDLQGGSEPISVTAKDVLYDILPPFHSFGFSVAGFYPIFSGMKLAFYPDPTDSFSLAEGIDRWKVTLFCSAPSFAKGLMAAAKPEQLQSLRYFVTGAEKMPTQLKEKIVATIPNIILMEGYGITECSPILTVSRPDGNHKGVGYPIRGVEVRTIHPETLDPLPPGIDGEICVRGPNVFQGYLGKLRDPFIEIDGKKWYRTGDLGYLDADGSLVLSGRLKRFVKVGGEMISLGAVEDVLASELIQKGALTADYPGLAVCADEKIPGKPHLIVFTTIDLSRDEANQILQEAGFSRIVKIYNVLKVKEIPLMGTGKTNYRNLQATIG